MASLEKRRLKVNARKMVVKNCSIEGVKVTDRKVYNFRYFCAKPIWVGFYRLNVLLFWYMYWPTLYIGVHRVNIVSRHMHH